MSVSTVVEALISPDESIEHHTVRILRLPRAVVGLLAGGALAVSGVILQTLTRNPLASSSTLGIHSGSYFAIVFATVFFPVGLQGNGLLTAFAGGVITALIVYVLSGGASSTPVRMVLAGMVVTILFSSMTSLLQIFYEYETAGLFLWGSGTLVQNDWSGILFALPFILGAFFLLLLLSKQLNVLRLGDDVAVSRGGRIKLLRATGLIGAVFLTAVTVSVVGPIGFVGLIAPHLMKLIGYRSHLPLMTSSFIWGGNVLIGADILARIIDPSLNELPVGAITAFIGAPWLIWLVLRRSSSQYGEKHEPVSAGQLNLSVSYPVMLVILTVGLLGSIFIGISAGNYGVEIGATLSALFGNGDEFMQGLILDLRLPRILVAALSGAILAVSGLVFQGVLRNPLADPSVIGITSGAGVGALLILYSGVLPASLIPLGAFTGAVVFFIVVMLLSYRANFQPALLALIGIGMSAFGSAIIQILVVQADMGVAAALTWLSGTTYAKTWEQLLNFLLIPALILLPILFMRIRPLDILSLGDDVASGLGVSVSRTRFLLALIATFLAAASVATVGTIGFIGLIAPHLARMFVGSDHKRLLPYSAFLGAIFLVIADILSRTLLAPKEIPSGILVAMIGAPYFLWLMYRSNRIKMKS